jgi:hypothetical protein
MLQMKGSYLCFDSAACIKPRGCPEPWEVRFKVQRYGTGTCVRDDAMMWCLAGWMHHGQGQLHNARSLVS